MPEPLSVWPGVAYPLGATHDGKGVNFALYSERATKIEVCLFDSADPNREIGRFELSDVTNSVWHGYVPNLPAGTLYGYRVHGPWQPEKGLRFNPAKLLTDPYARAVSGGVDWKGPVYGSTFDAEGAEKKDDRDSAPHVPRSVVVADDFDWSGEKRPEVIWRKTIVYELHVKGFTQRHPGIPEKLRGTYAGLGHPAAIEHLQKLGVTSVELLPVHERVSEGFLTERGLSNYWGYNTLSFFAPDQRFSSSGARGEQVREFKQMVKALHAAGLEVLLDVVYNHSCEGNERGPELCFRGVDNPVYYWLDPQHQSHHRDFTGCGNSMAVRHPATLKLVLDSLRYWVTEMHVDGFRFDLCTTLGRRGDGGFDSDAPFFQALSQDPVLSRVKLIAEPWDIGDGGYRLGSYPLHFSEWNDRYRETVRRFWRGDDRLAAEIGYRLTGSSDLFKISGRRPTASVNFVTCHDGFTLHDLVTYSHKHNELNGEENRDGAGENHSFNCGHEGETDDPLVNALRDRQKRNLLATLFLSVGTPMISMGDEVGRTQLGNNNAYCQDNELSWMSWDFDERQKKLLEFAAQCIKLRQSQPVLQRRNFFLGATLDDSRFRDLVWFRPDGKEMGGDDWNNPQCRCLGMFLGGDAIGARRPDGSRMVGDSLLVWLNAGAEGTEATLPPGEQWEAALETSRESPVVRQFKPGDKVKLSGRSVTVLRQIRT
ncbi:MAG: glycogen debranching protein GlgX [Myxococcaceae bacterium]